MNSNIQKQAGFTLIETLIVTILLGIVEMTIILQVTKHSNDATLRSLGIKPKYLGTN